ncbi:hypothetical protein ACFO25_02640 [Paenactinomyces guangxiensis]|uniref:Uncharacterized protein n=1 Tax=Paenactinomyces guangxiensis TaxID=1490290 RepID=A0A7W1WT32_9BACL|nr:hypothetical protein [Paenactinomyces guangxiensis]MBA4495534.1 hypothetical protein [Paenactinomyces guangxiensis]MBH8592792.1 hypothetical protein [Paenactinomyces guangxiensis]
MQLFYILVIVLFLGFGIYYLFFGNSPAVAVHFLLIALYFFVTLFEFRRKPFSRNVYLLVILLLIADGIANLFIFRTSLLSGIVSIFFAFIAWQTYQRLKKR